MCQRPDWDDLPHTEWLCTACGYVNSCIDATCQNIDCTAGDDCDASPAELEGDY